MAQEHDLGAERCGSFILEKIRSNNTDYRQVFSTNLCRIGDFDWPRPDFVMQDTATSATYALEYKPPMQNKREYICGLGQAISYLQRHTYSGLIIPEKADDGFLISNFIKETLCSSLFSTMPISLFTYNENWDDVAILKPITSHRSEFTTKAVETNNRTFWCWWRDMSHYDLFELLRLSFIYSDRDGDIYSEYIYPNFWNKLISNQCRDFDGRIRQITDSEASKNSMKQNYRIPLVQLGLCTSLECRLTPLGFDLLKTGSVYGPNSLSFKSSLAKLILLDGKHLELITIIDQIQKHHYDEIPSKSKEYAIFIENILSRLGLIGKRKPTAVTTNAKGSYLRDEFKLWNKFGLLDRKNSNTYFIPNTGLSFNWEKITEIISK